MLITAGFGFYADIETPRVAQATRRMTDLDRACEPPDSRYGWMRNGGHVSRLMVWRGSWRSRGQAPLYRADRSQATGYSEWKGVRNRMIELT